MKRAISRQTAICVALFVLVVTGTAHAQTKISDCTTITEPGSYVVTKNITPTSSNLISLPSPFDPPSCIVIAADFVTLDLAGFTIDGSKLGSIPATGIIAPHPAPFHKGIVVHSGTVANFTGGDGVLLLGSGHTVHDIRAISNNGGIEVTGTSATNGGGHRIVGNTAISNAVIGIGVRCPAVVLENVAAGNGSLGGDILTIGGCATGVQNSPAP